MKKLIYCLLIVIFVSGLFLRVYPSTQFDKPLKYDSYYHVRIVELMKETGSIPSFEPWPYGGRPHIYPPLYHLALLSLNTITGIDPMELVKYFLPIMSALTILVVFWLVNSFVTKNAALLASLFTALNPYLISSSYDSPQVLGLMLSCFVVYFLLKKKYISSGLMLGVIFLINTFSALLASFAVIAYMLLTKKWRQIPKVLVLPVVFSLAWYLPRLSLMYCYDNSIGAFFVGKTVGGLLVQEGIIILTPVLIAIALMGRIKGELQKFYLLWIMIFTALFLSSAVTSAFQPWRQSIYVSFGFSILLGIILDDLSKARKLLFSALFMLIFLFGLSYFIGYPIFGLSPPLSTQEYKLIDWVDQNLPPSSVSLAHHDMCAGLMTYTNKTCVLDICFECIENKTAFYDYENFFWLEKPASIQEFLNSHPISHILYRTVQFNEKIIEQTNVNRIYSAWSCTSGVCDRPAMVYENARKLITVRLDDVWRVSNNGLQQWGYNYSNLEQTLAVLKKHNTPVILSVTPEIFDPTSNRTLSMLYDQKLNEIIAESGYQVALHGATHDCSETNACEFDGKTVEEDVALLNASKATLETVVGKIAYFVPPKDRIDANLSVALEIVGLRQLTGSIYDPITSWDWENKTVGWRGFNPFGTFYNRSGTNIVVIHYNIMSPSRLAELDAFLSGYENR
jgi:peptidoglycan/xylan/chitin deacetylase (PgdA/CDA1 family)